MQGRNRFYSSLATLQVFDTIKPEEPQISDLYPCSILFIHLVNTSRHHACVMHQVVDDHP